MEESIDALQLNYMNQSKIVKDAAKQLNSFEDSSNEWAVNVINDVGDLTNNCKQLNERLDHTNNSVSDAMIRINTVKDDLFSANALIKSINDRVCAIEMIKKASTKKIGESKYKPLKRVSRSKK
jgi:DNA repair ATPase RecN